MNSAANRTFWNPLPRRASARPRASVVFISGADRTPGILSSLRDCVHDTAQPLNHRYYFNMIRAVITLALVCTVGVFAFDQDTEWKNAKTIYDFHALDITGNDVSLEKYRGHVTIIVNVASQCGLTEPNYKQLQQLYEKYGESKGLRIVAFPSNQFANQEPGSNEEIMEFVKKYNVTFDMMGKITVNGDNAHPLYKWMKSQDKGEGFITDEIKWNFSKFLIDKEGKVVDRFAPTTEPLAMEDALNKYF